MPPLPLRFPFLTRILDYIYPARCQLCETSLAYGRHLCPTCIAKLTCVSPPFCERCGECFDGVITQTFQCPNCNNLKFAFEFARAGLQNKGEARRLIHDFKYLRHVHLARELGQLAALALDDPRFTPYLNDGFFTPVPLYWKRQRMRQFNQSSLIARQLGLLTQTPVINAIRRIRHTETQTRFNRDKRLINLKHAFQVNSRHVKKLQNKSIILVDDVFTTGSTAHECSKVLLQAGAKRVAVVTVLRG